MFALSSSHLSQFLESIIQGCATIRPTEILGNVKFPLNLGEELLVHPSEVELQLPVPEQLEAPRTSADLHRCQSHLIPDTQHLNLCCIHQWKWRD